MHRNVSRLSEHLTVTVEQGTGEIPPFLDVGGKASAHEHRAHLFGQGSKAVFQNLKANRIDFQ